MQYPQHKKNGSGMAIIKWMGKGPHSVMPVSKVPAPIANKNKLPESSCGSNKVFIAFSPQVTMSRIHNPSPITPSLRNTSKNMLCEKDATISCRPSYTPFTCSLLFTEVPIQNRLSLLMLVSKLFLHILVRSVKVSKSPASLEYTRSKLTTICRSFTAPAIGTLIEKRRCQKGWQQRNGN